MHREERKERHKDRWKEHIARGEFAVKGTRMENLQKLCIAEKAASSARSRLVSCPSANTGREEGCVRETCRSSPAHSQRWSSCQELGSKPWLTSWFYSGHQGSVNTKHQALTGQWVVQRHSCPLSAIHWDVSNIVRKGKWGKSLWTPESASQPHNSSTARIFW